ncbi:uncharacterized protein LOC131666827 isoform X2 [Phymastichus coffea]|uniref:uncharacterized protein LOC131666827 isoform X2 n=1 Tax=Phymastichus coffea TaxID=108790 RepID=UPI00273CA1E9|nr:uncharacterized protein LOC131666827 isoform X2 [Phymastichus coffea]
MCTDNNPHAEPVWTIDQQKVTKEAVDYNQAIAAIGYGPYNVLLLLAALPIAWTCLVDTTSTAFIINSSECEFELTMLRRGIACSAIYIGMSIAGPLWDFFLQDWILACLGRKNVIVIGILLDAVCNVLWANATSFYTFVALKFVSGLLIAGPLSIIMAYLAEFHAPLYQVNFTRWAGLLVMVANVFAAGTAATLLRQADWLKFTIHNHFFPTWRIYLLVCGIPSLLGLFTACLLPKSPKFLIAQGRNDEALKLFQTMYSWNHFKSSSDYPVKELIVQSKVSKQAKTACKDQFQVSIKQIKALFSRSNIKNTVTLMFLQFSGMIAFNVMRLWVPPLWVTLNNFRVYTRALYPTGELITMCEMLFPRIKNIDYSACNYTLPHVESAVYVNSTSIVLSCAGFGFLFAFITTTKARQIVVIIFTLFSCTVGSVGANWSIDIPYMLVAVAFVIVASRITLNTVTTYSSQFTPQPLRPTALGVLNFTGNLGAAVGNVLFAVIISIDCLSAFLSIGCIALISTFMPLILIKAPSKTPCKPDLEKY